VGAAVDEGVVKIGVCKVGAIEAGAEVRGVIEAVELGEVFGWVGTLAVSFEGGDPGVSVSHGK